MINLDHITNMEHKVYIIKSMDQVVHIGYTTRSIERRLIEHKCNKLKGIENLTIYLVDVFDNKKDARLLEDSLQKQHGLLTDTEKKRLSASVGSNKRWSKMSAEERSLVNSNGATKRWESKSKEERSRIIKKGHETRKNNNNQI